MLALYEAMRFRARAEQQADQTPESHKATGPPHAPYHFVHPKLALNPVIQ